MADVLVATVKRGTPEKGIGVAGIQHLQFCDFVRVASGDIAKINSGALSWAPMTMKAYLCMAFPLSAEARLRELITTKYDVDGVTLLTQSEGYLDPAELEKILGYDVQDYMGSAHPIVDGALLSLDDSALVKICSTDGIPDRRSILDHAVITSGVNTYGSGGDYSTRKELVDDVGTLTGAFTMRKVGDSTETAQSALSIAGGGNSFTHDSDSPSAGIPTAGHLTQLNFNDVGFSISISGSSGGFDVSEINDKRTTTITSINYQDLTILALPSGDALIHHCIIDGDGKSRTGFMFNTATPTFKVWNLIAAKVSNAQRDGFRANNVSTAAKFENCVTDTDFRCGNKTFTIQNTYAGIYAEHATGVTGNNSASTGSSAGSFFAGSGNLTSKALVDSFLSTDPMSADFYDLKLSGDLDDAGILSIMAENVDGIRGNARPNGATAVSIGAVERLVAGGAVAGQAQENGQELGQGFGQF